MPVALIKGVTDQTKDGQRLSVLLDSQGRIIVSPSGGGAALSPTQTTVNVTIANTAVRFAAASTPFHHVSILAFKTASAGANTGSVFYGASGTGTLQPIEIPPGGREVIDAPPGEQLDLHDFWVNAPNANDGVVLIFY